jgi:hypothetical protein
MINANRSKKPTNPDLQLMQHYEVDMLIDDNFPGMEGWAAKEGSTEDIRAACAAGKICSFDNLIKAYDIDVHWVMKSHSPENIALTESLNPCVMINLRNTVIYKPPIINLARIAMFNIHSGELPTYRGLMAAWRAMIGGDAFIQPSLHLIEDAGIDVGALVGMGRFPVDKSRSFLHHSTYLYTTVLDQFVDTLNAMKTSPLPPKEALRSLVTDDHPGTRGEHYYKSPTDEELAEGRDVYGVTLFKMDDFQAFLDTFYVPDDDEKKVSTPARKSNAQTVKARLGSVVKDYDSEEDEWIRYYHTMPASGVKNYTTKPLPINGFDDLEKPRIVPNVFDIFGLEQPVAS